MEMSTNSVIFLAIIAMVLGVGLVTAADSFAQENATMEANQTTAMGNTTEMSNQTDPGEASGQVSFFNRGE